MDVSLWILKILLIGALLGWIPAVIAVGKGRRFIRWYLYGSLLFFIALIHVLFFVPPIESRSDRIRRLTRTLSEQEGPARVETSVELAKFGASAGVAIPALEAAVRIGDGESRGSLEKALRAIRESSRRAALLGSIRRALLFAWVAACLLAGFLWAPEVPVLGATTRVLYFHIPAAWITVLALGWSMLASMHYLRWRQIDDDHHAAAAAELGIIFCVVATISGSMWAKAMWGSYWNWDPRETSIFFLLLIYSAYLALRSAVEGEERRARLSAVYSASAFVAVPFLMFVVPRIYFSLHPDPIINPQGKIDMDPRIRIVFFAMLAGFTGLFFWLLSVRVRFARIERARMETLHAG